MRRVEISRIIEKIMDNSVAALGLYDEVKAGHEKMCARISSTYPLKCVVWDSDAKTMEILSRKMVLARFNDMRYTVPANGDRPARVEKFITRWLGNMDFESLTCSDIVAYPSHPMGPIMTAPDKTVFNVFPGFRASNEPPFEDMEEVERLVEPIIMYIRAVICGNHEGRTKWFLEWLANILQRPLEKHKTGVVVNGEDRIGKGLLPDFFRECVLGPECSFKTSDVKNTVFARFAVGVKGKVFLQLDAELHGMDARGQLNGLIMNDSVNFEERYKDRRLIKNLVNVYMTTNSTTEEDISWKYALFEAGAPPPTEHGDDALYYEGLRAHLARPEVARAFYQFLMARDLSQFHTCSLPPTV
jgi:hypothetical protein